MSQQRRERMFEQTPGAAVSDADLVMATLQDPEAFTELYERYADRLYRYALVRLGDTSDAADIAGTVMLTAFEELDRFDAERGTFAAWIFTIASRRIADRGRMHRRFWRAIRRGWRAEVSEDAAIDVLIQREDALEVLTALRALSDGDREILLLRHAAQLNSTQIGERLDITPANARVRLRRARQRLARELHRGGFDGEPESA